MFVGFEDEIVGGEVTGKLGVAEQGGGDAPADVVAVVVGDDMVAGFGKNLAQDVGGGGFTIGAGDDDDFGLCSDSV